MSLPGCDIDPYPRVDYGFEPERLTAEAHHAGDHLGNPTSVGAFGPHLLVTDDESDWNLHVVDASSGELVASVGAVGEGAAQFMRLIGALRDEQGRPWVVDGGTHRATRLDLDLVEDESAWAAERISFGVRPVLDAVRSADGSWIVEGLFAEGRYALLEAGGELIAFRGDLPSSEDRSALTMAQAYETSLAAHPDHDRFVAVGRHFAEVLFLDRDGRIARRAEPPIRTAPEFEEVEGVFALYEDQPIAYSDVVATRARIYALFSGRSDAEFRSAQNFGRDVHVFDWGGALLTVLRLDRDALRIAVDDQDRWLYAVEHEPRPAILRYVIPR